MIKKLLLIINNDYDDTVKIIIINILLLYYIIIIIRSIQKIISSSSWCTTPRVMLSPLAQRTTVQPNVDRLYCERHREDVACDQANRQSCLLRLSAILLPINGVAGGIG